MAVKIENQYTEKLPRNTLANVESALASVPREHLRGIERVRLVSVITEPRARMAAKGTDLPGLYHPRQGTQGAWFEVAITPLTSANKPFLKQIIPRLSFKGNLAAVVFSLIAQHYHLTLRHSVKRGGGKEKEGLSVEAFLWSALTCQRFGRARLVTTISQ